MERFFKRKLNTDESSTIREDNLLKDKQRHVEINDKELEADPGKRTKIMDFHPNDRDLVRREYLRRPPCQPVLQSFPLTVHGKQMRRFNRAWYNEFPTWLEYSVHKDAAYCLYCYLFKPDIGDQSGGESFVGVGFRNWKKKEIIRNHVGGLGSAHNIAYAKCQDLMKEEQSITTKVANFSSNTRLAYRMRLDATIDCVRFLLKQGLAFRGHDESEDSCNQGNFLELLSFLADHNDDIKEVVLQNAPQNLKLVAPCIQKDIVSVAASETIKLIIKDVGDSFFSILVDEARDVSIKEQMAMAIRYVDIRGKVVERFVGVEHVKSTDAHSLFEAIKNIFLRHGLSISKLRGQGYDGASNMKGEFNGLKALILNENSCAYYIHCFAHQLQLALVAVSKHHEKISTLFILVGELVNVIGSSCKRRDALRDLEVARIFEELDDGNLESGKGLNQETNLKRAGDTRWGSHYKTLISVIHLFSSSVEVLEDMVEERNDQNGRASILLELIQTFEFVFNLHMMRTILGVSNDLSQALQRKDQDIVNAMELVNLSKRKLQLLRGDDGWTTLLNEVCDFCVRNDIEVPSMSDIFVQRGRKRRNQQGLTNEHHYRFDYFYFVLDAQMKELDDRFTESTTELLLCMASLNPADFFARFDKERLIRMARLYPLDFSPIDLLTLEDQLDMYIDDMRSNKEFSQLSGISELASKMVEKGKDKVYRLVYLLLNLALVLPVATASVERAFSAMNIVKNKLRNRMNDDWLNETLIVYIEKEIFEGVGNETIIKGFNEMRPRRAPTQL